MDQIRACSVLPAIYSASLDLIACFANSFACQDGLRRADEEFCVLVAEMDAITRAVLDQPCFSSNTL